MSEENNVLDLASLDQYMDMNKPLNHYFVNSSHNTYLNGLWRERGGERERERGKERRGGGERGRERVNAERERRK